MIAQDSGHLRKEEVEFIENVAKREPDLDLSYSRVFSPLLLQNPNAESGNYRIASDTGVASLVRKGSRFSKLKINFLTKKSRTPYPLLLVSAIEAQNC